MLDAYKREINYLRISVTDRCNLRCIYCMPAEGITLMSHAEILTLEQIAEVAKIGAEKFGITKVRLTGGEPLVRKRSSAAPKSQGRLRACGCQKMSRCTAARGLIDRASQQHESPAHYWLRQPRPEPAWQKLRSGSNRVLSAARGVLAAAFATQPRHR